MTVHTDYAAAAQALRDRYDFASQAMPEFAREQDRLTADLLDAIHLVEGQYYVSIEDFHLLKQAAQALSDHIVGARA